MEKRHLTFPKVMILSGSKANAGTISNLSKSGMILHTEADITSKEKFIMLILYNKNRLAVTVKISGNAKKDCSLYAYAVEVLNPPKEYFELVKSLKIVYRSNSPYISRSGLFEF